MIPNREFKLNELSKINSSASEIDNSVAKKQIVLPKNLISNGISLPLFSSITGWTASTGDSAKITAVQENFFGGSAYLHYLETEIGTSASFSRSVSFSLVGVDSISFYVWVDSVNNYSNINLELYNVAGSNNYFYMALRTKVSVLPNQWNNVILKISDFTKTGTISTTSVINSIKITGLGKSGTYNNMKFGGFVLNQKSRTAITFSFDDGYYSDYTVAYPTLKKYGFSGISYIISSNVGGVYDAPRVTLEQLLEMKDNGWQIGLHGSDSLNWVSDVTITQAEASIKACKEYIYANNLVTDGAESCAYPHGEYNDNVIALLNKYNVRNARTTDMLKNVSPVDDLMKLKLAIPLYPTLQQNIDALELLIPYGGLINIYGHELTTTNTKKCSPEVFDEFVNYIDTNYRRYVTTIPQWCKDYETGTII